MSASDAGGLSAASTNRLRVKLTELAEARVFPVLLETALYGELCLRPRIRAR